VAAYNYGKKRFGADGTTSDGDDFYEAEGVIESALVEDEFFDADGEDHSEFLDDFSNGNGYFSKEARAARQAARQEKRDKKGAASTDGTTPAEKKKFDLDKTLGQAKQGAELLGTVKGMFGKGGAPTGAPEVVGGGGYTPPADEKGMSTGAKIGIAVGAVALVGIIIYVATRKKGAKAGK
jgi:hypothetical protein